MLLVAERMMKEIESKDLLLENLQLVNEQSTQLKEGIVSNLIMIYVVVIKQSLYYMYTYYVLIIMSI